MIPPGSSASPALAFAEGDDKNIDHVVRTVRHPFWRERIAAYLTESPMHGCSATTRWAWDWFAQSYRFVSVPGAGHWLHQDAPLKVNREIRSWLDLVR
ncbi:alpha/beta hydrolase [Amycolatopsis rhabdoformis]|uniref:Alpha/beta hydrolase n=1 Tax=Amycolatopsis rhabdoformis TaxID=1448059 RepID=A0ABZ1IIN6_9PSEU|nr:alpha/beta hydrolase [Amycolatopsis rhabdoformis]WSE33280.1 alpha/beta hydrolase [Amycolatopsis rhabdoformis]